LRKGYFPSVSILSGILHADSNAIKITMILRVYINLHYFNVKAAVFIHVLLIPVSLLSGNLRTDINFEIKSLLTYLLTMPQYTITMIFGVYSILDYFSVKVAVFILL
jgi:hypothetical protein